MNIRIDFNLFLRIFPKSKMIEALISHVTLPCSAIKRGQSFHVFARKFPHLKIFLGFCPIFNGTKNILSRLNETFLEIYPLLSDPQ